MASKVCLADTDASNYTEGRFDQPDTVRRSYTIFVDDPTPTRFAAEQLLLASVDCPDVDFNYSGLFRKDVAVEDVGGVHGEYTATATWERWRPEVVDTEFLSGSVSQNIVNVQVPFNRVGSYTALPAGQIHDPNAPIGQTVDGVDGVDWPESVLTFSIRRIYANGTFTLPLLVQLSEFCNKPNSAPWRGFGIGNAMLMAVDGDDSDSENDEITYTFQAKKAYSNLSVPAQGGTITIPLKRGFDYLWYYMTKPATPPASGMLSPSVHTAYVDEIEEMVDLNLII